MHMYSKLGVELFILRLYMIDFATRTILQNQFTSYNFTLFVLYPLIFKFYHNAP